MRPGVCTAPEPAPERDRPSEGCQLAVLAIDFAWKLVHPPSYVNGVTERRLSVTILLDALWLLIPPPHRRQGLLPGPDFVERLPLVQAPVLHDVPDLPRVVD